MSRLIVPIGIDIEKVKSIFGSKDEALYHKLLDSSFFKKYDEEFSFKTELYAIIFSYIPFETRIIKPTKLFGFIKGDNGRGLEGEWNDYGYALLTICCYLGNKLSNDDAEFIYGESWSQINTSLIENAASFDLSRMLDSIQVFDTPFEYLDIYTNSYSKEEVIEFVSHLLRVEKDIKSDNLPLFSILKKGLVNCRDNNLDLIIFSYEL